MTHIQYHNVSKLLIRVYTKPTCVTKPDGIHAYITRTLPTKRILNTALQCDFAKATPNQFPVSRPPPAWFICQARKFHYFHKLMYSKYHVNVCMDSYHLYGFFLFFTYCVAMYVSISLCYYLIPYMCC